MQQRRLLRGEVVVLGRIRVEVEQAAAAAVDAALAVGGVEGTVAAGLARRRVAARRRLVWRWCL